MAQSSKYKHAWLFFLFFAIIAAGAASTLDDVDHPLGPLFLAVSTMAFVWIASIIVSLCLAVAVHESGHLVAGWIAGFSFISVEVFGVGLRRSDRGLKLYRIKSQLAGGMARMKPLATDRLVSRFRIFIAGGPIVTALFLIFGFWIFIIFLPPRDATFRHNLFGIAALGVMTSGITLAYGSLIPRTYKGLSTDALLLWQLRKEGPEQLRLISLTRLGVEISAGVLARDWPIELVEGCASPADSSAIEMQSRYLRYYYFADCGLFDEAWEELEQAAKIGKSLGTKAGFFADMVTWESVYASAWLYKNLTFAQGRIPSKTDSHEFIQGTRQRALAAIAILEGKAEEALKYLVESRNSSKAISARVGSRSSTDAAWLDAMEAEARKQG
ncbi:hypothetical protein BH11ARM1_BH11ARM1_08120 [soil metagenome]